MEYFAVYYWRSAGESSGFIFKLLGHFNTLTIGWLFSLEYDSLSHGHKLPLHLIPVGNWGALMRRALCKVRHLHCLAISQTLKISWLLVQYGLPLDPHITFQSCFLLLLLQPWHPFKWYRTPVGGRGQNWYIAVSGVLEPRQSPIQEQPPQVRTPQEAQVGT